MSVFSRILLVSVLHIILICNSAVVLAAEAAPTNGFWERENLTGDWGGARTNLSDRGITLGATEVVDLYGNVSGGTRQMDAEIGRLELDLDADFEKLVGIKGLTGHASAFNIQGKGITAKALNYNLAPTRNSEAEKAFELFTLWLEQSLWDDTVNVRAGQLAADDEFALSEHGALYLNATFGWPVALAATLPSGGPAFPLATPGVRLRLGQNKPWSVMAAVFSGDPAVGNNGTPQHRNPSGTNFEFGPDALMMAEAAYALNSAEGAKGLPGTYKLGFWYHTGDFDDQRFDNTGVTLASGGSTGIPASHENNYGFYAIADQTLWQGEDKNVGIFLRGFLQPQEDRNMVPWQVDAGVNLQGLFFGRKDDVVGIGFSYAGIGSRARGFDRDTNIATATHGPVRDYESVLEVTYQAVVTPWLTLQPDFQYIWHPGGNVVDPTDASGTHAVEDAAVIGVRAVVKL